MSVEYSLYEAKARFSEVIRIVRSGQRVVVTYRGDKVAEIRPVESDEGSFEDRLKRLQEDGSLGTPGRAVGELTPVATRPGALKRFLEDRE